MADACLAIAAPRTRRAVQVLSSERGEYCWPRHLFYVPFGIRRESPRLVTMTLSHQGMTQRVLLAATEPNYGGLRWWFECPGCERRRSKLFKIPYRGLFLCRLCHCLSYESAQLSGNWFYEHCRKAAKGLPVTSTVVREYIRAQNGGHQVANMIGRPQI